MEEILCDKTTSGPEDDNREEECDAECVVAAHRVGNVRPRVGCTYTNKCSAPASPSTTAPSSAPSRASALDRLPDRSCRPHGAPPPLTIPTRTTTRGPTAHMSYIPLPSNEHAQDPPRCSLPLHRLARRMLPHPRRPTPCSPRQSAPSNAPSPCLRVPASPARGEILTNLPILR